MIKKTENCLYCGEKMESKTAKKKFCCNLHRVYWNREFKNAFKGEPIKSVTLETSITPIKLQAIKQSEVDNSARIAELEKELKNPPKNPVVGMKVWKAVREKELNQLKQ